MIMSETGVKYNQKKLQLLARNKDTLIWTDATIDDTPCIDTIIKHLISIRDKMPKNKNEGIRRNIQFDEYEKIKSEINIVKQKDENMFDAITDVPFFVPNEMDDEEDGFVRTNNQSIDIYGIGGRRGEKNRHGLQKRNKIDLCDRGYKSINFMEKNSFVDKNWGVNKHSKNLLMGEKMITNKYLHINDNKNSDTKKMKHFYTRLYLTHIDNHDASTIRDLFESEYLFKKNKKTRLEASYFTFYKRGKNALKNMKNNKKLILDRIVVESKPLHTNDLTSFNKVISPKKQNLRKPQKTTNAFLNVPKIKKIENFGIVEQSFDEICQLNNIVKLNLKKHSKDH
ncbi:hypothetical protein GVAV_000144 [Gurleya vavrai]